MTQSVQHPVVQVDRNDKVWRTFVLTDKNGNDISSITSIDVAFPARGNRPASDGSDFIACQAAPVEGQVAQLLVTVPFGFDDGFILDEARYDRWVRPLNAPEEEWIKANDTLRVM